jgi:ribosomal protein S18 acetylase RimI-like enzyme
MNRPNQSQRNGILIRNGRADEWQKLVGIYEREGLSEDVDLVSREALQYAHDIGADRLLWFAISDSVVVGTIQLILRSPQLDFADGTTTCLMHHLRVSKDFEGHGIGSRLIEKVEKEADKRGFARITLEVKKENEKAQQIYEHWGYRYLREGDDPREVVMIKYLEKYA